jgi:hypothetical protein
VIRKILRRNLCPAEWPHISWPALRRECFARSGAGHLHDSRPAREKICSPSTPRVQRVLPSPPASHFIRPEFSGLCAFHPLDGLVRIVSEYCVATLQKWEQLLDDGRLVEHRP